MSYTKRLLVIFLSLLITSCATHNSNFSSIASNNLKTPTHGYAPIQNGYLEYYRIGHGTPILLVSGYGSDITSWDERFLKTLSPHHQLIIFNNRNVGGSVVNGVHYTSQDLAKDIHQLIQVLHVKKPTVLGISMGGMIAQQVAVTYPNDLSHLILINTAIAGKQSIHPSITTEKLMLNMPANKLARFQLATKLFFPKSQRNQMGIALAIHRFQPLDYRESDLSAIIKQQRSVILNWAKDDNTAKQISKIKLSVLILNGEADEVIPPANSVILAKKIPHSILIRWQDGGHAMTFQHPQEIADSINEFLKN